MNREACLKKVAGMLPRHCLERIVGTDIRPHMMLRPYLQDVVVARFGDELIEEAKAWLDRIPAPPAAKTA